MCIKIEREQRHKSKCVCVLGSCPHLEPVVLDHKPLELQDCPGELTTELAGIVAICVFSILKRSERKEGGQMRQ